MILPTSAPAIRPTIAPAGPNTAPAAAPATERTRAAMSKNLVDLVGWAKPSRRANARPMACPLEIHTAVILRSALSCARLEGWATTRFHPSRLASLAPQDDGIELVGTAQRAPLPTLRLC